MSPQRVTLITLGVSNIDASKRFYAELGWQPHEASMDALALYQLHGQALALFPIEEMAKDQMRARAELGHGAVTLAQNYATEAEVDEAFDRAVAAGARPIKRPQNVFWGGYSGYWADPDGHVWEVARNPFWPLDDEGRLTLPQTVDGEG